LSGKQYFIEAASDKPHFAKATSGKDSSGKPAKGVGKRWHDLKSCHRFGGVGKGSRPNMTIWQKIILFYLWHNH